MQTFFCDNVQTYGENYYTLAEKDNFAFGVLRDEIGKGSTKLFGARQLPQLQRQLNIHNRGQMLMQEAREQIALAPVEIAPEIIQEPKFVVPTFQYTMPKYETSSEILPPLMILLTLVTIIVGYIFMRHRPHRRQ
jgi:hypothetical protein